MPESRTVTACVIIIGNEILSGRTQEANLAYLAKALNGVGIRAMEARVVRDDERAIAEAIDACRTVYEYVFTTGGIGPTHDDITASVDREGVRGSSWCAIPAPSTLLTRHYGRGRPQSGAAENGGCA